MFTSEASAETILKDALAQNAKHIWIEPQENYLRVRIRVGENTIIEVMRLPSENTLPLVAQFKKLAGLDLSVNNAAQRGYLVFTSTKEEHRFATMSLPTRYGEKIVVALEQIMP